MIHTRFYHPFNFLFVEQQETDLDSNFRRYGFSLDFTTEIFYYSYDWGYGFCFRVLGFGLEISRTTY